MKELIRDDKQLTPEGMNRTSLIIELYKQIDETAALQARVVELEIDNQRFFELTARIAELEREKTEKELAVTEMLDAGDHLHVITENVFDCLTELVALKKWKDEKGKDAVYEQKQPLIWKRAFELVEAEELSQVKLFPTKAEQTNEKLMGLLETAVILYCKSRYTTQGYSPEQAFKKSIEDWKTYCQENKLYS